MLQSWRASTSRTCESCARRASIAASSSPRPLGGDSSVPLSQPTTVRPGRRADGEGPRATGKTPAAARARKNLGSKNFVSQAACGEKSGKSERAEIGDFAGLCLRRGSRARLRPGEVFVLFDAREARSTERFQTRCRGPQRGNSRRKARSSASGQIADIEVSRLSYIFREPIGSMGHGLHKIWPIHLPKIG